MLVRLSLASALATAVSLFVYIAGNAGTLSDRALFTAVYAAGAAGLATVAFAIAGLIASVAAPAAGARFSLSSIIVAVLVSLFGLVAVLVAAVALAVTGGLAV